jgi:dipeptidyl aminopeptidase/acylaminoacyl peptidase
MKSIARPFRMLAVFAALGFALMCAGPLPAQPNNRAEWTPMQMMQVKRIGRVDVSPDGKRVVYAVREAVLADGKSEYLSHIHLANADGSGTTQLTKGPKSCDEPQWSSDGKLIAFLSTRSGKRNLWLIGPAGGEPTQLTDSQSAVTSFKWLPNSKRIAFTRNSGTTQKEEKSKKQKDDARVVDENVTMSSLYCVDLAPMRLGKRLVGNWTPYAGMNITGTGRGGYDWSPDGKRLVFSHTKTPNADDWTSADISSLDGPGFESLFPLAQTKAAEYSPRFSPDGKWIAYVASDDPPTWAGTGRVHVIAAKNGKPRVLGDTFDGWGRFSELIGWSADSKSLYFSEIHGTVLRLGRLPLEGPAEIFGKIDGVATGGVHLNAARTHFGFSWETLDGAPEAYLSPVDRFEPTPVSRVNASLPNLPLGRTEVIHWKSKDGLDIEGLLTYPADYKQGRRYPLLLNVHGGPMGVFTQTYVVSPGLYPIASFSSRGYAVLRPNPRGSSGYGKKFRYANYGDWGGGDYQDLMTGVDHVIQMGVADPDRLGVMGWSYGGFMTSWIVTQTKRFKAASVGAGITNLMSFTGTSDIPSFLPDYFGGEYWDKFEAYRAHSAMFHVKGVKTPTLIQHGERDERVPLSQGKEFYNALKRQGCTTKMVIYPRTPHGIEEPRLLVDCMERNLEWFDRYVGMERP